MIIILLLNIVLPGAVSAVDGKVVRVYTEGRCESLLKYNGYTVGCVRVSYYDGRVEQPAYCLERDIPGIGENEGELDFYNVEVQDTLTNTLIWRVISNSYPYVSLQELGVNSINEAFVATKQAVYCILYGNDGDNFTRYTAIGEAGERTLNLLKRLVNNARNSNETRPSKVIDIIDESNKWQVDNIDKNYISKTYSIRTEAEYNEFQVSISSANMPEDTRIVNLNNQDKTTFGNSEKFKVLIPINHNVQEGSFTINVTSKLRTCPVYYGKAPAGYQDYALAANPYEDGNGSITETFTTNNSKIIIIKKDGETKEPIKDTEFNILDANKKIVYSNLITNSNGEVILEGIEPGTYYLQEVRAANGYIKMEGLVEFKMELDKVLTLTVNNNKVQKSEVDINTEDINVNVEHSETDINISTGEQNINENNSDTNINISDNDKNINVGNTDVNINIKDQDENSNIQNTDANINVEDKNVNSNIQNTDANINVEDENVNSNIQNTDANINVDNKNTNSNIQNTNADININNKNTNSNIQNTNTNTNIENTNANNNIQNVNTNSTIKAQSENNIVKKLPKTGY